MRADATFLRISLSARLWPTRCALSPPASMGMTNLHHRRMANALACDHGHKIATLDIMASACKLIVLRRRPMQKLHLFGRRLGMQGLPFHHSADTRLDRRVIVKNDFVDPLLAGLTGF